MREPVLIRVFVPTYRRPLLLRRAIESLMAQTLPSWVCDIRNDDPADPFPEALAAEFADPRIRVVKHAQNLGAIETFNAIFRCTPEPYYSLLEDDNFWEPTFLARMLAALEEHPSVAIAWCNQRVWIQTEDDGWRDTGAFVNRCSRGDAPELMHWGHARQALGALHSNGAMLVRSRPNESFNTPSDLVFGGVESFRERMMSHPLLYVSEPLANFSMTKRTARSGDDGEWMAYQTVLLATFVRNSGMDAVSTSRLCDHYRRARPSPMSLFINAALICGECRPLLRHVRFAEWIRFARGVVRHPVMVWRALTVRRRHPNWWELLDANTAARFAERRAVRAR